MSLITNDGDKLWCVYVHISPSGKYYVGITSQKPKERWRGGKGYKGDTHFTRAIKKYGWDNFEHEIVASNLYEQEAKNFEVLLISKLKSNDSDYGYNVTAGGDGAVGVSHCGEESSFYGHHHTDETKELLSTMMKQRWSEGLFDSAKCKPVYQFDMDGNLIASYKSSREAMAITGIDHGVIGRVCRGDLNYTHGYTWAYQEDCDDFEKFKFEFLERLENKNKQYGKHMRKPINLYDLDGSFIAQYESASELSRCLGLHKDTPSYACRHGNIMQGKYRCSYA